MDQSQFCQMHYKGEMINTNSLKRDYPLMQFGMEPGNSMVWQEGWTTQDLNVLAALEATQGRVGRPDVSDCILQIAGKRYRATFNIQLDPISENNRQPNSIKEFKSKGIPKNHTRRNICYKKQKTFSEKFKEFVKNVIKDNTDIIPFNCCQCTKSGTGNTFKRKIQNKFHYKRSHPGKILSGMPCVAEGDKENKTTLLNENRECMKDMKKPVSNNFQDVKEPGRMSTVCSTRKAKETSHIPVENNVNRGVTSEAITKKQAMSQTEFSDDLSEVEIVRTKEGTDNILSDDCDLPACDTSSHKNEVIVIRDIGDECQSSPYCTNSQESPTGSKLDEELCFKDDPTKETSENGSCDEQRCPVLAGTYNDEHQASERNKANSKTKRRKGKCTCFTNKESSKEAEVKVFVLDKSEMTRNNEGTEKQGGPFVEQTLCMEKSTENTTAERQHHKPFTNENPFFQENKKSYLNAEQRRNKICEFIAELTSKKSKERTKKNLKKLFERLIKNHNEELRFINRSKLNSEKLAHIKRRLENNTKPGIDEFNDHFLLIRTKDKNLKQIRKNGEINKKNDNVEFPKNCINKEFIDKLEEKNVRDGRKSQLEEICYLIMSCNELQPRKCYREMFQYKLESALVGSELTSKNTYRIVKETDIKEDINQETSCENGKRTSPVDPGVMEPSLIKERCPGTDWRRGEEWSSARKGRKAWAVKSRKTKTLSCKELVNQVSKDGAKSAACQKGRGTKRSINHNRNKEFNKKSKKQISNHKMGAAHLSKHNKLSNDTNKRVKLKCTKLYRRNVKVQRRKMLNRRKSHVHNPRLIKKSRVFASAARSVNLATSDKNSEENGSGDQTETCMNVKDGGRKAKNQEERLEGQRQVDEENGIIDSESQDSSESNLSPSVPSNIVFSEELELGQMEAGKCIPPNISRKLSLDSSISTSYFLRKTDGMPVPSNYVDVDAESSYTSLWLKRIRRISSLDKKLNEVLNERKKNEGGNNSRKEPSGTSSSGTCMKAGAEESQVTVKCTQQEMASEVLRKEATTKTSGRRVSFNIESPSDSSLSSYVLSDGGTVLEGISKLKGEMFLQKDRQEYLEECVETQWLQKGQRMDQERVLNKDSLRLGTKSRISPNKLKEENSKIRIVDKVNLSPDRQQINFTNKRSKSKTLLPNNATHLQYVSVRNNEYTKPRCDLDSGIELSQSSKANREMPQPIYTKNKKYNERMSQPAGVKYKPVIRRNVVRSISHAEFNSLVNRFNSSSGVPQCPEISQETIDEEPLDWRSQSSRSCPLEIHDSHVQSEKGSQGRQDEFTSSFPKFCTLRSLHDKLSPDELQGASYNVEKHSRGDFQIFPAFTDNREINRPSCSQSQCAVNNASLMKVLEALKDDQISASIKPSGDVYKILLEGNDLNSNWHIQKADGNIIVLAQHTAEGNGAHEFSQEGNVSEDGEQTTNKKKYCRPCGKSDGDLQKNHAGLKKKCCSVKPVDSCTCCLACPRDGMRDQEETSENKHPNSSEDSCTCCPACPRDEYSEQKGMVQTKYDLECIDACCCCEACPREEGVRQQNKGEINYNYSAESVNSCICCQCSVDDQQNSPDESLNTLEHDDSQFSYKLRPHGQVAKCCQLKSDAPCCDACPCCDQESSKRNQDSQLEIKEGTLEKRIHTKTKTEKPMKDSQKEIIKKQQYSHESKPIKNTENSCQCCEACPKKSEHLEEQKKKPVTTNKAREIENITDSSTSIQVEKDVQEESSSTNSEPIDNLPRKAVKIQQNAQKPKKPKKNDDSEKNCLCCEACPKKNYAQQERMPKVTQSHASVQVENDALDESNSTISEELGDLPRKTVTIQKLKKQPRNNESENNCKCFEACPKKNDDLREDTVEQHKVADKPTPKVHFPSSQERTVGSENSLINEHKVKKELNSSKAVQIEELSAETIETKKDSKEHSGSKITKESEKTCTCCEACPKQAKDQKNEGVQVGTSDTSNKVPVNENLINPEPNQVGALVQSSYGNLQSASKTVIEPNENLVNETAKNQIIVQEPETSRRSTRLTEMLEELLMEEGKINDRNDSLVQSVRNSRISQLLEELVRETVKIQLYAQEPSMPISKNEPTKICLCGTRGVPLPIKADETQNPTQFQTNTYVQQSKESQNYMQYVPNSRTAEPVELHQERVRMQQYSQGPTNTQRSVITTNMCLCCEACPRGTRNMQNEELDKLHRPVGEVEKMQWNTWDRQHATQPLNSPGVVMSVSDTYQPSSNTPYNHQPQVETMAFENRSVISGRSVHPSEHSMIKDNSQESSPLRRNPPNVIPLHYVEEPLELDKKSSSSRIVQNRVNSDLLSTQEVSSNKHNEVGHRYPSRENEISNEANKPIPLSFSHLTNKSEDIEGISAENDKQPVEEGHPPTKIYSAVMSQNRTQNNITHHNKESNESSQMGKKSFQEGSTRYSTLSHDSEIEILAPLEREISGVGQKYIRIDESTRVRRRYEYPEERCAKGTRGCVSEGFDVLQYPEIIRVRKIYDKGGRIACAKDVVTPHSQKQAIIIQDTPDNSHKYKNESHSERSMGKQEHRRTPVIIRHPDMPPTLYKCAYRKPKSQTINDGGHVSRESSYSCGTNSTTILVTPVFHQGFERRRKHGWRRSYSVMDHPDGDHVGSREHKVTQQPREVSSVDKCFCGADKEILEALERGEDPPGGPCVCSECPN